LELLKVQLNGSFFGIILGSEKKLCLYLVVMDSTLGNYLELVPIFFFELYIFFISSMEIYWSFLMYSNDQLDSFFGLPLLIKKNSCAYLVVMDST